MSGYRPIRVLIVDDSAFMRSALKGMLKADAELEVIDTARDGWEAIEKIEALKPDIVTMDIEMPRMDGLTALKIIMEVMPVPVLVVSSLTEEGAATTMVALELGAVDFVYKDLQYRSMNIMNIETMLVTKIKEIVGRKLEFKKSGKAKQEIVQVVSAKSLTRTHNVGIVAIGASTGGPKALHDVIPYLPKDFLVPVLVVQHMPELFTKTFAERLSSLSQLEVKEAEDGEVIEPGKVYIARGGIHMRARKAKSFESRIELSMFPEDLLYRPSVNVMMSSVAEVYHDRVLGVIMTGMGNDGTQGLREIKEKGGKSLGQDEESCVVYGMPKCAQEAGVVDKEVPLSALASEIVNLV